MQLYVIREGDPMEFRFFSHFVEDKSKTLPSYYEFLVSLQRYTPPTLNGFKSNERTKANPRTSEVSVLKILFRHKRNEFRLWCALVVGIGPLF